MKGNIGERDGRPVWTWILLSVLAAAPGQTSGHEQESPGRTLLSAVGHEREAKSRRQGEDRPEVEWLFWPACETVVAEDSLYADIMNHCHTSFQLFQDRPTTAHETTHLIHAFLRNKYSRTLGRRVNAFYVGNDRAVIVDEPGIRKSSVGEFIPKSLRGGRYQHYIEEQEEWDDTPLYVFDEWVAYVNDSIVAIAEAAGTEEQGLQSDSVHSCVEFFVYAAAVGMAVEKYDPKYFKNNSQFRAFLAWHLKRSMRTYRSGMRFEQFRWKPEYFQTLRSGAEAEEMRAFLRRQLGLNLSKLFD